MVLFLVLILVALAFSSLGFKKYIWFISIGYGLAVAAIGVALLIAGGLKLGATITGACVLLILYGLRLGGFLAVRDRRNSSYTRKMQKETKSGKDVTMVAKVAIWVSASLLYVTQTAPLTFRILSGKDADVALVMGMAISIVGFVIETLADIEKSAAKKKNPNRFVDTGLYSIVRCPNYFGEMLFWTGVFIGGLPVYSGPVQWIVVLIGYLGIIYVMFSVARRLEIRQNRTYGKDLVYKRYVRTTPIMIPLVPLYSVANIRWLVA